MTVGTIRLTLLRTLLALLGIMSLFVQYKTPTGEVGQSLLTWGGYAFIMAGLGLRIWSKLYLGARRSRVLVTEGPYSLCRNPLYVGTFSIAIGAGLLFGSISALAVILLVIVPVHLMTVKSEERLLEERFGDAFQQYRSAVPRFLLSPSKYRSSENLEVSSRSINRAAHDAVLALMLPPVISLIGQLQFHGIIPVLWHLP